MAHYTTYIFPSRRPSSESARSSESWLEDEYDEFRGSVIPALPFRALGRTRTQEVVEDDDSLTLGDLMTAQKALKANISPSYIPIE